MAPLWSSHISTLDQKSNIIVTLDGILLALTASLLGTALSRQFTLTPSVLFGVSTILVLVSAGACTRVAWVRFFSSAVPAKAGSSEGAYPQLLNSRTIKTRYLHFAIVLLLAALTGYAATILLLLAQL